VAPIFPFDDDVRVLSQTGPSPGAIGSAPNLSDQSASRDSDVIESQGDSIRNADEDSQQANTVDRQQETFCELCTMELFSSVVQRNPRKP
jgi:hypothetical protein